MKMSAAIRVKTTFVPDVKMKILIKMKKITIISIFLAVACAVTAQRISIADFSAYSSKRIPVDTLLFTVQYDLTMMEDLDHPENHTHETMMLRIGKKLSEYYSYTSFIADSVLRADVQAGASQQTISDHLRQYGFGVISHRIYKNYPSGRLTMFDRIAMDNLMVEEPMPNISWKILSDTTTVCGYICQKAVTSLYGRDYEVWFTYDIPRNDGPWKLWGLPGLILKSEDSQGHYRFVCTGIEQSRDPLDIIEVADVSRRKVSRKELNKLHERFNADPQGYIKVNAPNVKISVTDEMGNTIKKMSNPYNPIEKD